MHSRNGWTFWALVILAFMASTGGVDADDDLRALRAVAIRSAAKQVESSIVRVEKFGVIESGGEVSDDAPTVAIAIDNQRHFIASSLVTADQSASIVLVDQEDRRSTAKIIATDHHRQLVLLEAAEELNVPPVTFSDPTLQIGQTVVAVGRIAGDGSVALSSGVLSAEDRLWGIALQTDARVSSVFYGGALVNLRGEFLGVIVPAVPDDMGEQATAWYDAGVAFAIPASAIAKTIDAMVKGEDIRQGLVGIVSKSNDPYVESTEIAAVKPRSPAARAGIEPGDTVLSVDGQAVRSHREIKQILGAMDAPRSVVIELKRGDETLRKDITLAESIPPLRPQSLGITVGSIAGDDGVRQLVVTGLTNNSPVANVINVDDVITAIGGSPVDDIKSFRQIVYLADPDEPLSISLARGSENGEREAVDVNVKTIDLVDTFVDPLPESLRYVGGDNDMWEITELSLTDIANKGAVVAPKIEPGSDVGKGLGLLVLLADPGSGPAEKLAEPWREHATKHGVVVCIIAPADPERWQADEVDVAARVVASIAKRYPIDDSMVVIGSLDKGAGASMAIAVGIGRPGKFAGLAVAGDARPPAIRLRENDPSAPLQMLIRMAADAELPPWTTVLEKAGFPIIGAGDDPETLMRWVRSMPRI